jgi:putative copper resistance protein D
LDEPLIWVRIVHFAAAISVTGALLFLTFIAEPAFRKLDGAAKIAAVVRSWLTWIEWSGLVLVVLSGAAWLVLKAAEMGDVPWPAVFSEDLVPMVLSGTDFGQDWIARSILAAMLAAALLAARPARAYYRPCLIVACVLAFGLIGTLAWAGHAAATGDGLGPVHIVSDILHLVAAGAWVGALLPLALVLGAALVRPGTPSIAIAREVVLRFSMLGIGSVGALLATGVVNTWVIVGGLTGLTSTAYGRLLLFKIALFFAMLSLAAVNRLRLTPVIQHNSHAVAGPKALRRIRMNAVLEAAIGLLIVAVVSLLGTLSPTL